MSFLTPVFWEGKVYSVLQFFIGEIKFPLRKIGKGRLANKDEDIHVSKV
jgi:hypothetical protein